MKLSMRLFSILGLLLPCLQTLSQEQVAPLFEKKDILPITIETNLKLVLKEKAKSDIYHWANLSYLGEQRDTVSIPLKMKARGNFRLTSGTCNFPPLLINFPKKKIKHTLFEHQTKLKLVTQCIDADYVVREYMVYEIYNLITNLSFKARLAEVKYIDSLGKLKPKLNKGFFIENELDLSARLGAKNSYIKTLTIARLDTLQMATLVMFEYLIGNNDWSVPGLHNIKLFTKPGRWYLPVPYDFDHAGIVEAPYALPPPQLDLGITTVRERAYRGLDYSPEIFKQVFDKFNSIKPQLYALYEGNPHLEPKYIKRTLKYFDDFYEEINDPKAIKKYFRARRM